MPFKCVMLSNHPILCLPLLLLLSIFPSIRVFSNESVLHIRWPKYWSFSFSVCLSIEYSWLISFRMDWLDLLAVRGTLKSLLSTTVQKHQLFSTQPLWSSSQIHTWLLDHMVVLILLRILYTASFANKGPSSQCYSFSSGHVWMWKWTIKKAECWRIDAFEPWCWRRLLRVPWTARRSNEPILKEISPGCSL